MDNVLMKCGHVAQGVKVGADTPICVICAGITPDAEIPADTAPDLSGRVATCHYCTNEAPSNFSLPFFEHGPSMAKDSFYCGCYGWE